MLNDLTDRLRPPLTGTLAVLLTMAATESCRADPEDNTRVIADGGSGWTQATETREAPTPWLQPWLDEVRAQREALARSRQDYHEARMRAHHQAFDAQTEQHELRRQRLLEHLDAQHHAHLDGQRIDGAAMDSGWSAPPALWPPARDPGERQTTGTQTGPPQPPRLPWLGGPWSDRPVRLAAPRRLASPPHAPAMADSAEQARATGAIAAPTVSPSVSNDPLSGDHPDTGSASTWSSPGVWDNGWYYRGW